MNKYKFVKQNNKSFFMHAMLRSSIIRIFPLCSSSVGMCVGAVLIYGNR